VYAVLGVVLLGYFVSLILRDTGQSTRLIDGWLVAAFELLLSGLCLARAFGPRRGRAMPLVLGGGLLSWSIGDIILTAESSGGAGPPTPSFADLFYLGFYPLVYVALILLMRRHITTLVPSTWLDGAVAGLGVAGVCACFAFTTILQTVGGDAAALATNLAYPIGDVLLLVLVVGGTAILPGRRNPQWLMLAGACALNAAGDTFNLFESTGATSHVATIFNGIAWPTSILLISASVWLRPGQANPLLAQRTASFLLPALGACAGVGILFVGSLHPVQSVAIGLATATMLTVGVRLALSVRRLRSLTEKRHRQAITDELTGLGNRRHLFYLLNAFFTDQADPRTAPRRLSLLFIDLDHFKEINDSFGHAAGDELLRQLGPRLSGSLRDSDVLVRVGGDELAVVTLDTDAAYAAEIAGRLMAKLREPFVLGAVSVRISAAMGIATAPADAADSAGLLRCADLAMYRAKSGPSPIELYSREVDDGGNQMGLVEDLRVAVEAGRFELHFQPQVDLRTREICGVEALLRWPHPRLGLVAPLDFLPLAEEAGLMTRLTEIVLDSALRECAAWHAAGRPLTVSVNISVSNLLDPAFLGTVRVALATHRLHPSSLILEITETTMIRDFDACKLVIAQLRDLGLGVSLDDFGAGFTSLAYLGSLAVSELKLDRTFITGLASGDEGRDLALVRATIDLGHALAMRVVAEGVEDAATLELLRDVGCDVAQGYHIGRPLPAGDLDIPSARPQAVAEPALAATG
jgi:diguanylate cyclase (GGDEF)-like protein